MKLEYRGLSSSRTERIARRKGYAPGFADFLAASLLLFVVAGYLILPKQVERAVDYVIFDPASNSFASFRCIREKTFRYPFTVSRDVPELRASVRIVHHSDLDRYGKPQPDPACYAANGFVERVPRWEYFFGWLTKAVS